MLFDAGPHEFPIATVRPTAPRAHVIAWLGALRRWLVERASWLRPRLLPMLIATAGLVAVLGSASYLHRDPVVDHARPHAGTVVLRVALSPPPPTDAAH